MSNTKIKSSQFHGVVGHGTDGYFLITNGDGSMSWIANVVNPVISSLSYPGSATAADPAGGETITITGTGFKTGATVTVGGTAAPSVSYVSATSLTITTPAKTAGDYDVVVTNTDGGTATSVNGISFNGIPSWTTAAGSLGTFASDTTISTITLQASEPDAGTITFSITNGALPTGLSLTGADIDGTTTLETADTLYTFTVTATDDESQATPRTFTITVEKSFINTENFTPKLYTGGSAGQVITGVGFQPDLIIGKRRDSSESWFVNDVARTGSLFITTAAEISYRYLTPNSDGFVVNGTGGVHNTGNLVAYCFKGGGAAVSGSGTNVSSVTQSENAAAGFGIYRFTTTSSDNTNITINHNLNAAPEMVIAKETSGSGNWYVYHSTLGTNKYILMSSTNAATTASSAWGAGMTSSVIGARTAQSVDSGETHVMYAFHSVDGYQKIGSYTGQSGNVTPSSTNSIGFEPRFLMIKRYDAGSEWYMFDSARGVTKYLEANTSDAEKTLSQLTFSSTGFSISGSLATVNESFIYLAIA